MSNHGQSLALCLADVCRVLEIGNSHNVVARLDQDGVHSMEVIDSMGRTQQATFISEPNLYRVIFQSRKPQAEISHCLCRKAPFVAITIQSKTFSNSR